MPQTGGTRRASSARCRFNPVRLKFIRETAERHFGLAPGLRLPLEGLRLLDIGCGGGLVSSR